MFVSTYVENKLLLTTQIKILVVFFHSYEREWLNGLMVIYFCVFTFLMILFYLVPSCNVSCTSSDFLCCAINDFNLVSFINTSYIVKSAILAFSF